MKKTIDFGDTGGLPKPPLSILSELRGISPDLFVVPLRWEIDLSTGQPKLSTSGEPIERPRYHVFVDSEQGPQFLFTHETPEGEYLPCDRRIVERIGTDLIRKYKTAEGVEQALRDLEEEKQRKAMKQRRERTMDWFGANSGKVKEALREGGKSGFKENRRDPILYSYNGQPIRSSNPESVPTTSREQGWYDGSDSDPEK